MTKPNSPTKNTGKNNPPPSSPKKDKGGERSEPQKNYAMAPNTTECSPYWEHRWGLPVTYP